MRLNVLIVVFCASFYSGYAKESVFELLFLKDTIPFEGTAIENIDVQSFIGKPVRSFIDSIGHDPIKTAPDTPVLRSLSGWVYEFDNELYIIIRVYDFEHIIDTSYKKEGYDYNAFEKEKIGQIMIRDNRNRKVWIFNENTR